MINLETIFAVYISPSEYYHMVHESLLRYYICDSENLNFIQTHVKWNGQIEDASINGKQLYWNSLFLRQ